MVRDAPSARAFSARRGLAYLGGFAAYGVGLSALYASTGRGLPCLFQMATGWDCPLCGGTRLGSALLQGDVVSAFGLNPLVLVGLFVLSVLGLLWSVEAAGGPAVRPPRRVVLALREVSPVRWLVLGLGAGVGYVLLRNLV